MTARETRRSARGTHDALTFGLLARRSPLPLRGEACDPPYGRSRGGLAVSDGQDWLLEGSSRIVWLPGGGPERSKRGSTGSVCVPPWVVTDRAPTPSVPGHQAMKWPSPTVAVTTEPSVRWRPTPVTAEPTRPTATV